MLVERGRLKLRQEKLQDKQTEAGLEKDEQEIETTKFTNQVTEQNRRSRLAAREHEQTNREALQEKTKTQRVEDVLKLEALHSELEREEAKADILRRLKEQDADADISIRKKQELVELELEEKRIVLQRQKMEAMLSLEMQRDEHQHKLEQESLDRAFMRDVQKLSLLFQQQMQANQQEMNSRLVFLEKYAGLSKEVDENKLLVMALATDPRLAKPYVEATRAKGKDELIAKMGEFKDQLVAVHGKEDRLVHKLMEEGIRQLGGVLQKHLEKPVTQINTSSVQISPDRNET
jgi:hypothetical protein